MIMADKQTSLICENLSFAGKEAYKRLRTNVLFSFADEKPSHVIGVTSSGPTDGKSVTAVNLAFSLYELGKKVLLIDADMRRPSVQDKLEIRQNPGLSDLLVNTNDISACIVHSRQNEAALMDVIPAGVLPPNPAELLNSPRMGRLLRKVAEAYDFVIIDLPPVGAVTDAQAVSGLTDGMIVVVRAGVCEKRMLDECLAQLNLAKAKILGFVLNGSLEGAGKNYGGKYYK